MVVGVHRILRSDGLPGRQTGQVGEHFVDVHVGAGATSGLEHIHRKMIHGLPAFRTRDQRPPFSIQASANRLGRISNGFCNRRLQTPQFGIHCCASFFEMRKSLDHGGRNRPSADGEIQHGPLGRSAVQDVRGDFHLPHGITFGSGRHGQNRTCRRSPA